MKLSDMPTPEMDAAIVSAEYIRREMDYYEHKFVLADYARSFEQRLALAVAALRKIEINDDFYESAPIAKEALAQIEKGTTK